jgi:hypothetical protein
VQIIGWELLTAGDLIPNILLCVACALHCVVDGFYFVIDPMRGPVKVVCYLSSRILNT